MKRWFTVAAVLVACMCTASNAWAAIGWAGNVWPNHGANVVPTGPVDVYAQVWKGGVTDSPGQGADITALLYYTTDIAAQTSVAMTYNGDIGNNDEYTAQVPQAALVGATWVDVTVVFTDQTDASTFEVLGDQANNAPPFRYNVVNVLPNDVDVVFTLCMSGTATNGPPCVIGSAAPIGTWGTGVDMTSLGGDLWQVTVTWPAGSNPSFEYKYKKDGCANWEGVGNRPVTLPTDGTTLVARPTDSWDNQPLGCNQGQVLLADKEVCFEICMDGVENTGDVCVTGSSGNLTVWGNGVVMTSLGGGRYSVCITYGAGMAIPLNVEYKYRKDGCETWEGTGNRGYTIDNSSPPTETRLDTWDNVPRDCTTVGVESSSWGTMKTLFR